MPVKARSALSAEQLAGRSPRRRKARSVEETVAVATNARRAHLSCRKIGDATGHARKERNVPIMPTCEISGNGICFTIVVTPLSIITSFLNTTWTLDVRTKARSRPASICKTVLS